MAHILGSSFFSVLLFLLLLSLFPSSPLKISLINPLTGSHSQYGNAILKAQLLAIDEINQSGGIQNKKIEVDNLDSKSSSSELSKIFENSWTSNSISEIFLTAISSDRRELVNISEKSNQDKHVWLPIPYEGEECSKNFYYTGGNPQNQLQSCLTWAIAQGNNKQILFLGLKDSPLSESYLNSVKSYAKIFAVEIFEETITLSMKQQDLTKIIQNFAKNITTNNFPYYVINSLNDAPPSIIQYVYNAIEESVDNLQLLSFLDSALTVSGNLQTPKHLDCIAYWKGSGEQMNEDFISGFLSKYPETGSRWNISSEQEMAYNSIYLWSKQYKNSDNSVFNSPEGSIKILSNHQVQRKFHIVQGSNSSEVFSQVLVHSFEEISDYRSQPYDRFREDTREYSCDWSTKKTTFPSGENPGYFKMSTVKVGVLHSVTGNLAISETALVRADILAIDQINENGGVNGRIVIPIFEDGATDINVFQQKADKLLSKDKVVCIFGCWTSSSRQAVAPIVKNYQSQLYYPVQYEGSECEENIFYGGATPNQQLEPAIHWSLWHLSTDFFLIGSDYVYPRTSNDIARHYIDTFGGIVHGEEYIPLDDTSRLPEILEKVNEVYNNLTDPSTGVKRLAILNTLNGDGNVEFFKLLSEYGITSETHPVMSFSITEQEAPIIGTEYLEGHYASWNYFMSINTPENQLFVSYFQNYYGESVITNDPMEASFILINMWKQSSITANSFDPNQIRSVIYGQSYDAPENSVVMNVNNHLSKWARIGRINKEGQFDIVLEQNKQTYPEPWNQYLPNDIGYSCDFFDRNHGTRYLVDYVSIGILHSLTGGLSFSEKPIVDTYLMAIDSINEAGGVNGKKVIPKIRNGESDWDLFEKLAWNLTLDEEVVTVFGCWTSASRKKVLPVFRETLKTLWYPVQYEGQECEEQVFYGGAAPNQQIEPAVDWWIRNGCTDLYLVGSLYVFPQTANQIIRAYCESFGCVIHGEDYIPLDTPNNVTWLLEKIVNEHPNGICIFNTLNGDTNIAVFHMMPSYNMTVDKYPTMSVSIGEPETLDIGPSYLLGHFASWNYFQSVGTTSNDKKPNPSSDFVNAFQGRYGYDRVVSDPMEAAYILINIWKQAAETAGTFDDSEVRNAAHFQGFDAPEGYVTMGSNHHLTKVVRIGQVNEVGQFDIIYEKPGVPAVPWNQYIPETTGYTCDHSLKDKNGTLFKPPEVKIGIIYSLSGNDSTTTQRAYVDSYEIVINEWNELGGVDGKTIVPIIKNDDSSLENFEDIVKSLVEDEGVVAIFGGSSQEAVDLVTPYLSKKEVPLFTTTSFSVNPQYCDHSIFYSSPTTDQLLIPIINTFKDRSKTMFIIIGIEEPSTRYAIEVLEKLSVSENIDFPQPFLIEEDEVGSSDLYDEIRQWWVEILDISKDTNGALILNFFPTSSGVNQILFQSFDSVGLSKSRYPILSLRMSILEIKEINIKWIEDHMLASNYFSGLGSLISDDYDEKMILELFEKDSNYVPPQAQDSYTLFSLWANAVEYAKTFSLFKVRNAMYRRVVEVPQGNIFMEVNHRVASAFYIAKIGKFLSARVIYPTGVTVEVSSVNINNDLEHVGDFGRVTILKKFTPINDPNSILSCDFGPREKVVDYGSEVKNIVYIFSIIGLVLTLIITIAVIVLRGDRIIRAASVPFLLPILFSLSLGFVSAILFATEPSDDNVICSARIWVFVIGGMSTLCFLLIKNWRLYHIFNNSLQVKRKIVISTSVLFLEVGILMGIQIIILILWTTVDQSVFVKTRTTDIDYDPDLNGEIEYIPHCTVSEPFMGIQMVFSGLLLIAGTILSWKLKELPTNYNESKYVGFAIFLIVFFCIILIPVNFLLDTNSSSTGSTDSLVIIRGLGTTFATLVILLVIFLPKFIMMKTLTSSPGTGSREKKMTSKISTEIEPV